MKNPFDMSNDELRAEVAAFMDWKFIRPNLEALPHVAWHCWSPPNLPNWTLCPPPRYTESLDACSEFEKSMTTTARRLSKGIDVQGIDAEVREGFAYLINGTWYMPGTMDYGNDGDRAEEKKIQEKRLTQMKFDAAIAKAKAAGLSEEDIKALSYKN